MLPVSIVCVGRLKDKFFEDASAEYLKRLKGYSRTEIIEIPAAVLPEEPNDAMITAALEKEADAILRKIPDNAFIVALCIEGKLFSSEETASLLGGCMQTGKPVVFVIGGSCGLSDRVKKRADVRLSMSRMTFPHRLARVMLLEQIYRGFTIVSGKKYHK